MVRVWRILAAVVVICLVLQSGCAGPNGSRDEPANTVVLDESTLDYLSWVSEDFSTLIFENVTEQLSSLEAGDVIVCGVSDATPYGLLRKVTNIAVEDDQATVETEFATLEDAIEECDIVETWSLLPDGSAVPLSMVATGTCTGWYIEIDNVVLYDEDGDLGTTHDQVVASGSLCVNIDLDFRLRISKWRLREARFEVTTSEAAALDLELKITLVEFSEKVELYRQYLNPIVVWAGLVPVVITPVLTFNVGVDAEVYAGVATSITQEAQVTVGVSYVQGAWSPIAGHSASFGWEKPSLTAGCGVKGYAGPQLSLLLYGVTGPYSDIEGYLKLEADLFDTPWWSLYGGVEAGVGFRVEILGRDIADYEVPAAIGYRVLLAEAGTDEPVTFPDANLEAAIREAIGKPTGDIYPSDLEGLTSLDASRRGIADLTGLEYCSDLTHLRLCDNDIGDLSPLSNLTSLASLSLTSSQISDVSSLSTVTSLKELYLGDNPITDVTPLANLTNLTVLGVSHSPTRDISPLASLTNLEELALCCNQISDMSSLSDLTKLRLLSIEDNQISDASAVASLTNLEILWLADNPLDGISYLENLTKLTYLGLGNTLISDISALAHLVNLEYLELQDNQISSILPLVNNSGLGARDHVVLDNNPLSPTSINTYIPQLRQRGVTVLYGG